MSAVSGVKLKANCNAVNSDSFIGQVNIVNDNSSNTSVKTTLNNGTKLNKSDVKLEPVSPSKISIVKQETSVISNFQGQNISSDVQKVLKQEQELQKQLYSGSNVAPGWLRVNHNNKVIYISPSGFGLASLKQVKDYLLTRGTCKCGLPFPLRVELFFNFSIETETVPLKTPIDSIKFDPTCQHRKKLSTNQARNSNISNDNNKIVTSDIVSNRSEQQQAQKKVIDTHRRSTVGGECLLPSYVTSVNKIINQSSIRNNISSKSSSSVMIVNTTNSLSSSNNIQQPQIMQQQFVQHQQNPNPNESTNVVMRIIRDESGNDIITSDSKLPPWKKNSIQNQLVKGNNNSNNNHQTQVISTTSGIPIFQINGQMIAIDQQNQQFGNQAQQIQIIEQKTVDGEKTFIRRRAGPPNFKEDPTGYLNQQTALLHNSITTLHSPDGGSTTSTTSSTSPASLQQQDVAEMQQRTQQKQQFIQQIVKAGSMPNQVTTIGGQTVTHMSNGIVQIQNCDIKQQHHLHHQQQQQQLKPIMIQQEQIQQQSKYIRTNPKGRPPKNAATIAKRLVAMSQESPVSSTSTASSVVKITKSNTPDITSSSSHAESVHETLVQSSNFDGTEILKIARNSSSTSSSTTQELIRTSMTQVIAGKQTNSATTSTSAIRKPAISMMKKPQTVLTQVKTTTNSNQLCGSNNNNFITQNVSNTSGQQQQQHQVVVTSNGQQFIVMPSNIQQPQNIMLNSNNGAVLQIQNSGANANSRLIQTTGGQGGNFIIQTSNGNVLTTTNPLTTGNFIVNGQQLNQPLVLQNGQIIQNSGNIIASPKGNILVTGGTTAAKTIIAGNNQLASPLLGQQTVLLQNNIMPQSTIIHPSSFIQATSTTSNNQQQKIIVNPEKKKGRKRKIPLPDQMQSVNIQHHHQQQQQPTQQHTTTIQPSMIQMATPQNFQLASPTGGQQIILQNPINILGNGGGQHQLIPSTTQPLMALSADGNFVQLQNPTFNNIITTPQGMMIRAPTATATQQQQQQPIQKTIITNNGQQFIVQGGQLNLMNQLQPFNPMGFVVQTAAATQQNQQQIINPIVIQSPTQGQQIIAQPQILTHHQSPSQITTSQGTVLTQQAQFISQNESNSSKVQRKMMVQQKTQQQKFFPQMIKPPRTTMYTTTVAKNSIPTIVQNVIEDPEDEEEESEEMIEQEEENEEVGEEEIEHEELELSFDDDDKPDMIEELHHGTSQQILHSSAMLNDGQCGIMNIDDITIEMDEINDLNEYLNAIDEEDNKMSQMGLSSSLQHFANSPPDTTTHSPRSPNDNMGSSNGNGGVIHVGSERSNGSSEGNNMVSSSEADSNVVSPECHQNFDSAQSPLQYSHHHNSGMQQQPIFKLPMEPRSSIKSPSSYNIMNANVFDANNRSPSMRPDSHESTSSDNSQQQSQQHFKEPHHSIIQNDGYESSSSSSDEIMSDLNETSKQPQQQKSDFDLLKESPPVNTIRPPVDMIKAEDPPCRLSESPSLPNNNEPFNNNTEMVQEMNFKVGDLIWGAARGCDSLWPGKIVDGPEKEPTSSNCVWVKWFGGRQNTEMVQCNTLKSLSEGLEAHHAARKETRKGRKLNSHLERAIQKAMAELDKQSEAENTLKSNNNINNNSSKGNNEKRTVTSSHKTTKSRLIKIAPAPSNKR